MRQHRPTAAARASNKFKIKIDGVAKDAATDDGVDDVNQKILIVWFFRWCGHFYGVSDVEWTPASWEDEKIKKIK